MPILFFPYSVVYPCWTRAFIAGERAFAYPVRLAVRLVFFLNGKDCVRRARFPNRLENFNNSQLGRQGFIHRYAACPLYKPIHAERIRGSPQFSTAEA